MKRLALVQIIIALALLTSCKKEVHREYFDGGILKTEYSIQNGKRVGSYTSRFRDGKPEVIGQYKNGIETGLWKYYYSNGNIKSLQEFEQGKLISIDYWDSTGVQTIKEGTGTAILYYPNGQKLSKISYSGNVQHGEHKTWYEDGTLSSETYYENGRASGTWKFWDENGVLIREEQF